MMKDLSKVSWGRYLKRSFEATYDGAKIRINNRVTDARSKQVSHGHHHTVVTGSCKRYTKGVVDARIPLFPILQLGSE